MTISRKHFRAIARALRPSVEAPSGDFLVAARIARSLADELAELSPPGGFRREKFYEACGLAADGRTPSYMQESPIPTREN